MGNFASAAPPGVWAGSLGLCRQSQQKRGETREPQPGDFARNSAAFKDSVDAVLNCGGLLTVSLLSLQIRSL